MAKSIHDLVAFQRAVDLAVDVYDVTATFPRDERFGLISQLRRAAVGVVAQIAEGHGRITYGEWRQFLSQARGSLFEVEAESIVARRLGFVDDASAERIDHAIRRTGRALVGLLRWVQAQERSAARLRNRKTPRPR
ncbi:MAG TPA: four helix bundle protein [Thermoanaerobaculia bacterium]|jgi:four helix bundle protein|nr:four helix bundle protein [Thermoanaerobaculia bacterium]